VSDQGADLFLLRVGGAFTRKQQRLARQLRIEARIRHLGYVPSKQLPLIYRCAELLLFPSLDEGFGFPVLEAMASGLPVVASQRGALPEVAGQAALLADPSHPTALADRVRDLLKDSALRSQLKEAGRRRARQFTWDSTARKTLEVYRRVHHEAARNR
jgi:alpha-1,3-rhamnosyl/mannosyltransferase